MATDYAGRLNIPIHGHPALELYSKAGTLMARGYCRVVIGDRGPYVEFERSHLIPDAVDWDFCAVPNHWYYREYRSVPDFIKIYHQRETVDYADYKIGLYYITPAVLCTKDGPCLGERPKKQLSLF